MQGANEERWKVLCEQAAVEQDPKKLGQFADGSLDANCGMRD